MLFYFLLSLLTVFCGFPFQIKHGTQDKIKWSQFAFAQEQSRFDFRRKFFPIRVVRQWNRLPREGRESASPELLKTHMDVALWGHGLKVSTVVERSVVACSDFGDLFQPK